MTVNQDTTSVEYREISRLADYRFGNDGSAWTRRKKKTWAQLRPHTDKDGYLHVACKDDSVGKFRCFGLHRLILEAFVGPCPVGLECRHLDGNPANNRPENLEWATHRVNAADRRRHGTELIGARSHRAKLTEVQVEEIRRLRAAGSKNRVLSELYGVNKATITRITCGYSWSE